MISRSKTHYSTSRKSILWMRKICRLNDWNINERRLMQLSLRRRKLKYIITSNIRQYFSRKENTFIYDSTKNTSCRKNSIQNFHNNVASLSRFWNALNDLFTSWNYHQFDAYILSYSLLNWNQSLSTSIFINARNLTTLTL